MVNRFCCKLFVLLFALGLGSACTSVNTSQSAFADGYGSADGRRVVASLGIEVSGLRLSSAGYMLDFRYRVKDPEKATALMSSKIKPYLLVESTGEKLQIPDTPKLGLLRQRPRNNAMAKKDHEYFMMFSNMGRRLQSGDKVTVVVGETKIENLIIK